MAPDDSDTTTTKKPALYDVLGSATAGIFSRCITHPLDTARLLLKLDCRHPHRLMGYNQVLHHIEERSMPFLEHIGAREYEHYTEALEQDSISSQVQNWNQSRADGSNGDTTTKPVLTSGQEFLVHFASGVLAEAVACIIYVPVDVIKERMQVQQRVPTAATHATQNTQYTGSLDAFQKIVKTEGMTGIYRGYGATLASFGPFSALYFMFYERCKAWSRDRLLSQSRDGIQINTPVDDGDLPLAYLVGCSAGAGALASWLTSPLDMAKLRLQVQRGRAATAAGDSTPSNQSVQYRGMMDCLQSAYREDGVRALFRGAGARVLHFAPATTITMTCYEKCRSFYANALG
eukprot:scaffold2449_cov188-Alexandrium_tamarense.AAC.24